MANKKGRRRFGWVRKLPSGRFQASYLGPDGLRRNAPQTFGTRTDAGAWLTVRQSELLRGEWIDPNRGRIEFGKYAERWLRHRELADRTRDKYNSLLRLHIKPHLGSKQLAEITTEVVREWRSTLGERGVSVTTAAGAYRLLRAILNTAVEDERIRRNPCRIKGADKESTAERPVASVPQVYALARAVPARFRALIFAAAFTGLRWGELTGLRRGDVDLASGVLHVRRSLKQLDSGHLVEGPPKSDASKRKLAVPPFLVDELRAHLDTYVATEANARVFTTPSGGDLRRDNWHRDAQWRASLTTAGLPEHFHFHDLRHTGNQLASMSGASLKELMRRMGHSSVRAAMIYQHATDERDREIADALGGLVTRHRLRPVDAGEDERPASASDAS